jgi:hypothetical protein
MDAWFPTLVAHETGESDLDLLVDPAESTT